MAKHAKWANEPHPTKTPKWVEPTYNGQPLAWRFSQCDCSGPFCWDNLTGAKLKEVTDKLREFETKTEAQLRDAGCHTIECHLFEKEAKKQLVKIMKDDVDALIEFHITGPNRMWCIADRNIMRVLWWDPDHKVYKTERDRGDRQKRHRRRR